LSVAYVLGMALTYTIAGAAFAAAGQQAQAFFQKPWMIVLFAALFVWLALGMFGLFNLQVPPRSSHASPTNKQRQGTTGRHCRDGRALVADRAACGSAARRGAHRDRPERWRVRGAAALFGSASAWLRCVGRLPPASAARTRRRMDIKSVFGVLCSQSRSGYSQRICGPVTLALWAAWQSDGTAGDAGRVWWRRADAVRRRRRCDRRRADADGGSRDR
jgi:hypothetical protein